MISRNSIVIYLVAAVLIGAASIVVLQTQHNETRVHIQQETNNKDDRSAKEVLRSITTGTDKMDAKDWH